MLLPEPGGPITNCPKLIGKWQNFQEDTLLIRTTNLGRSFRDREFLVFAIFHLWGRFLCILLQAKGNLFFYSLIVPNTESTDGSSREATFKR